MSLAETLPVMSASGTALSRDMDLAIGGAVLMATLSNQATSFIGPKSVVNVARELRIESDAVVLDPAAAVFPIARAGAGDAESVAAPSSTARRRPGGAQRREGQRSTTSAPFLPDRAACCTRPTQSAPPTSTPPAPAARRPIAGGLSFIDAFNLSAAAIAPGVLVNQWSALGRAHPGPSRSMRWPTSRRRRSPA